MRQAIAISGFALLLAACGQGGDGNSAASNAGSGTNAAVTAADGNLAAVLGAEPRFAALVQAAGMTPVLEGKAPYTILAPTASALDALPPGTLERLQQPAAKAELTALLRRHILPGTITAVDLARAVETAGGTAKLATMAGDPLTVGRTDGGFRITDAAGRSAQLVGTEQAASNGVVHRIDSVLPVAAGSGSTAS